MAQMVYNPSQYILQLDAHEFSTVTRALARMAGMKFAVRYEEQAFAGQLNQRLLENRLRHLEDERERVSGALRKAQEAAAGSQLSLDE